MHQKLSFQHFAAALAALGAAGSIACGGAQEPPQSPVQAEEVPAASASEQMPEESAGMDEPGDLGDAPAADTAAPDAADHMDTAAEGESAAGAEEAAAPSAAEPKPAAKPKAKKSAGASGSCGAGTCG
jgi:hypothetical protein